MRGSRLLTVAALAALVAFGGCTRSQDASGGAADASAAPQATQRAPHGPDLAAVMERFYQQVEGQHWYFADQMLTPAYHVSIGLEGVKPHYQDLADLDVTLKQTGAATVVAHLAAHDRANPSRPLRYVETVRLFWDGQQWAIDSIARSDAKS